MNSHVGKQVYLPVFLPVEVPAASAIPAAASAAPAAVLAGLGEDHLAVRELAVIGDRSILLMKATNFFIFTPKVI